MSKYYKLDSNQPSLGYQPSALTDYAIVVKKFPRRESHSLEPEGTGFTDPPAYFNGLLRNKMEDPRVELGLKDFQSSARTGYTNLPNQDI